MERALTPPDGTVGIKGLYKDQIPILALGPELTLSHYPCPFLLVCTLLVALVSPATCLFPFSFYYKPSIVRAKTKAYMNLYACLLDGTVWSQ